jgi:ABC-2 type transport system permease protein
MTTISTISTDVHHPAAESHGIVERSLWALAAEWTKLRSVRSTVWALTAALLMGVALAALLCYGQVSRWNRVPAAAHAHFDAAGFSLNGVFLVQLVIASLGVLAMSAEYSSGTIRATLSSTPSRPLVLVTKAAVFAATVLVVGTATSLLSFLVGQAVLGPQHMAASLGDAGVLRVVVGGGLYLVGVGLLGLGLAAILRNTAAGISAAVGLLFVLPILARLLPSDLADHVDRWLPSNAGMAILHTVPEPTSLAPWAGIGVLFGYAALALVAGGVVMVRRDA